MDLKSNTSVLELPWAGSGHPLHALKLFELSGATSSSIQSRLASIGIASQALPDGPQGNYIVSVEGAAADRLEEKIRSHHKH